MWRLLATARTRVQSGNAWASRMERNRNALWSACPPFPPCKHGRFKTVLVNHMTRLRDKHGRDITDLRVSITDRCNYKCVYCRTGNEGAQYSELPFADYLRLVRIFVDLGIEKVRLTGGEPLLRNGLVDFVRDLSALRTLDGKKLDLAITTNGHLLAELVKPLKRCRAEPRNRQYGRRGCREICPHYARAQRI